MEILTEIDKKLIIEDDWLKLLNFYGGRHIKDLLNNYKKVYNFVKHSQNKKLLILLDKISDESIRFCKYLDKRTIEFPPTYLSKLTLLV